MYLSSLLNFLQCTIEKLLIIGNSNVFTMQPSESLYEQKPEEPPVQVSSAKSSTSSAPAVGASFTSRFEYTENSQPTELSSGGTRIINHVSAPKSSNFFAEYGMDSGFSKNSGSNSLKVQVREISFTNLKVGYKLANFLWTLGQLVNRFLLSLLV